MKVLYLVVSLTCTGEGCVTEPVKSALPYETRSECMTKAAAMIPPSRKIRYRCESSQFPGNTTTATTTVAK